MLPGSKGRLLPYRNKWAQGTNYFRIYFNPFCLYSVLLWGKLRGECNILSKAGPISKHPTVVFPHKEKKKCLIDDRSCSCAVGFNGGAQETINFALGGGRKKLIFPPEKRKGEEGREGKLHFAYPNSLPPPPLSSWISFPLFSVAVYVTCKKCIQQKGESFYAKKENLGWNVPKKSSNREDSHFPYSFTFSLIGPFSIESLPRRGKIKHSDPQNCLFRLPTQRSRRPLLFWGQSIKKTAQSEIEEPILKREKEKKPKAPSPGARFLLLLPPTQNRKRFGSLLPTHSPPLSPNQPHFHFLSSCASAATAAARSKQDIPHPSSFSFVQVAAGGRWEREEGGNQSVIWNFPFPEYASTISSSSSSLICFAKNKTSPRSISYRFENISLFSPPVWYTGKPLHGRSFFACGVFFVSPLPPWNLISSAR